MDYEHWRQRGVYFASDEQKINDFINLYYPGFDLGQVLYELDAVATKWNFSWDRIQLEFTTMGNLHVHHHYDTLNHDEEPLSLRRILRKPTESGRRVSHEEMIIPESLQRKGLSRSLIRPYYTQYKVSGVDCIDANAGDKGGGYALARYGFDATRQKDVISILQRATTLDIEQESIDILIDEAKLFYESHPPNTPFRIWEWSQTPFGETLLAGTYWNAVLDLHNSEQTSIFEEYLASEA
jgi:hypothetical protein